MRGVSKEEIVMATATQEAYCVKCRQKRPMKDAQEVTMKNGRRALKGQCEVCNTNMTLMLGNKQPA
jgi:galactose-1-phosphate uridylyltransferase